MHGLVNSVNAFLNKNATHIQRNTIHALIMLYLFRGTDQHKIRAFCKEKQIDFDLRGWAATVPDNGELLKNCKLFVYAHINGKAKTAANVPLSEDDRTACTIAASNKTLAELCVGLHEDNKLPVISFKNFDAVISAAILNPDLIAYQKHLVRSKLRFLVAAGLSASDASSRLTAAALIALYKAYPRFGTLGTMLAIAKTAMKNTSTNIIKEYTTQGRNIFRGGPGMATEIVSLSLDILMDEGTDGTGGSMESANLISSAGTSGGFHDSTEWAESTLGEAIHSSSLTQNEKDFILVISGYPHKSFSDYLGVDCTEASSTMALSRFKRKAAVFFQVLDPDTLLLRAAREAALL